MAGGRSETAAGNAEMAAAWDGPEGEYWAEHADRYDATGTRFSAALLSALPLEERSEVLDVGCGTGGTTLAIGRRASSGSVLGVDLSSPMLAVARAAAAAEGLAHVRFEQADAQIRPFPTATYDVVVSSFGAMFFADPVAAFANIRSGMRASASLVLLVWRDLVRNEWITAIREALSAGRDLPAPPPGAPGPFGMADPGITTERLAAAGFVDVALASVDEPVRLGSDVEDAWSFVSTFGITRGLTADLDDDARGDALARLRRALEEHASDDGVLLAASAWLVTARNGGAS